MTIGAADEGDHGDVDEGHALVVADADADVVVALVIVKRPTTSTVGFVAVRSSGSDDPIIVVDEEIAAPPSRWEIRSSGLWADHICETALDHWSYGLEAFGLEVDDPETWSTHGLGHRRPLGWELEFEADAAAAWHRPGEAYIQEGRGHGIVLTDRTEPIDGGAVRAHWWGAPAPPPIAVQPGRVRGRLAARDDLVIPLAGGRLGLSVDGVAELSWTADGG